MSYWLLTTWSAVAALSFVLFTIFGSYTKRNTVLGELVLSTGTVKVYSSQQGIVQKRLVNEGDKVLKGQVIFLISSQRQGSSDQDAQAEISSQIKKKILSLIAELENKKIVDASDHEVAINKFNSAKADMRALDEQIVRQSKRKELSNEALKRYADLKNRGFISQLQVDQKHEEALAQENQFNTLVRERSAIKSAMEVQRLELNIINLKQDNQAASIEREIADLSLELTENEARRGIAIIAPEAGIVTALTASEGQAIDTNQPLVNIIPSVSFLQVQLYAPSRVVGFVQPGDSLQLRYDSFPYQKYGHSSARVISVTKVAIPRSEVKQVAVTVGSADDPVYLIKANLDKENIQAYGKSYLLHPGMSLEADILQDTRKIYEWILEPLYSISGKL